MAGVSLKELLEAGAHFGHQTRRWNPKMRPFIFGARGGVHIIDLTQTSRHLSAAAKFARGVTAGGGVILFVCTKRQGKAIVKQAAIDAGMPYVAERWLGGMLTNFRTIKAQINRLKKLEAQNESGEMNQNYNKKEVGVLMEEVAKLNHVFGGIKELDGMPAALYVVDAPKEHTAVLEAKKLGIPVIAIADSNADPGLIDHPIPANDDAIKSIKVITKAIAEAAREGRGEYLASHQETAKTDQPAAATR
ncbi:30S ribosomal protein S2 [Candidatus Parcubacteria bacterium]|nr:30S ribosomal protein S2 [Candidatus Parcubacteria bacterium]